MDKLDRLDRLDRLDMLDKMDRMDSLILVLMRLRSNRMPSFSALNIPCFCIFGGILELFGQTPERFVRRL